MGMMQLKDEFSKQLKKKPNLAIEFVIAENASKNLNKWKVSEASINAAILVPLLTNFLTSKEYLISIAGESSVMLAERYMNWLSAKTARENSSADLQKTRSEDLRELLYEIYLDLPDFSFILLLVAFHEARFRLENKNQLGLAKETEDFFIPITQILGLWKIRRNWLEETAKIFETKSYQQLLKLLGGHKATTEIELREEYLSIANNYRKTLHSTQKNKKQSHKNTEIYLEKALAFAQFEEDFRKECAMEKFFLSTKAFPILQLPGPNLRTGGGDFFKTTTEEEYKNKMGIRIFCKTESDCYRVLGIIHKLGTPSASRNPDKFYDYISEPNPNGYQALHSQLNYRLHRGRNSNLLIQFRILTIKMYRLNEGGVITSQYKYRNQYQNIKTWWSKKQLQKLSSTLQNEYHISTDIQSYLNNNKVASNSDPLYVFTPDGEIKLLPKNSTTIDYAYNIHTKMVNYYIGAEVNGEKFSHGHILSNGDLVYIQLDTHSTGPNLSFLFFARTQKARSKIRKALTRRALLIHKGREILKKKLIRIYEIYRDKNISQDIPIATSSWALDSFLDRIRLHKKLNNIDELYKLIEDDEIKSDKIINQFITESLVVLWPKILKKYPSLPSYKMALCEHCWPAPSEKITLGIRRDGGIVIHSSMCGHIYQSQIVDIEQDVTIIGERTYKIEIIGQDNFRLVGHVLEKIYSAAGVYLLNITAQVLENREALIYIVIRAENPDQVRILKSNIEDVRNISRVYYYSYADTRKNLSSSHLMELQNPYSFADQLVNHMFFDRSDPISTIHEWLNENSPSQVLVLHGPRRVGKTALAKQVAEQLLKEKSMLGQIIPITINFDGISIFEPENITAHIVDGVQKALKIPTLPQKAFNNPFTWLSTVLQQALSKIGNRRILFIIDEFNNLIEQEDIQKPLLMKNLRSVINNHAKIKWLLITQEVYYQDAKLIEGADVILQEAPEILLEDLPRHYALKLIEEPSNGVGIKFQKGVPDEIYELASGNAYLIQVMCYYLISEVRRKNRIHIIKEDLDNVVSILLTDARNFAHLSRPIKSDLQKKILACVANNTADQDTVAVSEVQKKLGLKGRKSIQQFNQEIEGFVRRGQLSLIKSESGMQLFIPIKIFKMWLLSSYQREITL